MLGALILLPALAHFLLNPNRTAAARGVPAVHNQALKETV
jgi:hypothetical protein